MTHTEALAVIDARLDQIEADNRRRFASMALADGADPDEIDALLTENAAAWQAARRQAHALITHSLRKD